VSIHLKVIAHPPRDFKLIKEIVEIIELYLQNERLHVCVMAKRLKLE
jgi:hypothetical protein